MNRPAIDDELSVLIKEAEAEDRVINYLDTLSNHLAKVTVVKAFATSAKLWEIEGQNMLRRDDPRLVYLTTVEQRRLLEEAVATFSHEPLWQSCPDEHVLSLLVHLPPDVSALIMYKATRWVFSAKWLP